ANRSWKNRHYNCQNDSPPSWIFNVDKFTAWLDGTIVDKNTLWLFATTGFGKSVLAAYLIEEIPKQRAHAQVMYFFCRSDPLLQSAHHIIQTMLYQMTGMSPNVWKCVKKIWDDSRSYYDLTA